MLQKISTFVKDHPIWTLVFFIALAAASLALGIVAIINFDSDCPTAAARKYSADTTPQTHKNALVTYAPRAELRYPNFTLDVGGATDKVLSFSPITGQPVAGVRYVPYFSRAPYTTLSNHQAIAPFASGKVMVAGRHATSGIAIYTYKPTTTEGKYHYEKDTGGATIGHTSGDLFDLAVLPESKFDGVYLLYTVSTAGTRTTHVTENTTSVLETSGYTWTDSTRTGPIPKSTSIIQVVEDLPDNFAHRAYAVTGGSTAIVDVRSIWSGFNPASSNSALLTLSLTNPAYSLIQVPSATAHTWLLGVHESVSGLIKRWTLSYASHSSNGAISSTPMNDVTILAQGFGGASIVATGSNPSFHSAYMSDGTVIMVVKIQTTSQTISAFIGYTFDNADTTTFDVDTPWHNPYENASEIRILAHDPTDDTMLLSWTEDLTRMKIAYVQWDSINQRLNLLDSVERPGVGAIMSAIVVNKSEGKYLISNWYAQIAPLWVSSTYGTISFHPTLGRRPMGYVDSTGAVYALGMVVTIGTETAATLAEGNRVYCDEDGTLSSDGQFGERLPIGIFLGEDDQMIMSAAF